MFDDTRAGSILPTAGNRPISATVLLSCFKLSLGDAVRREWNWDVPLDGPAVAG